MPKISNSTFTISFTLRFFKLVSFNVWGIIFKTKLLLKIFEIVKETPLIEIEAFSSRCLSNLISLISSFKTQELSIKSIFLTFAVVSTWPWVKWPDISWPYFKDFSKLISSPTLILSKFERLIVSIEI